MESEFYCGRRISIWRLVSSTTNLLVHVLRTICLLKNMVVFLSLRLRQQSSEDVLEVGLLVLTGTVLDIWHSTVPVNQYSKHSPLFHIFRRWRQEVGRRRCFRFAPCCCSVSFYLWSICWISPVKSPLLVLAHHTMDRRRYLYRTTQKPMTPALSSPVVVRTRSSRRWPPPTPWCLYDIRCLH